MPDASRFHYRITWDSLAEAPLRHLIDLAREEDLAGGGWRAHGHPAGDATTALLDPAARGRAAIVTRKPIVACGMRLIPWILDAYGAGVRFTPCAHDGEHLHAGAQMAVLEGPCSVILPAERPLLNFLQHLGGISTHTARHVQALGSSPTRLLDTRKTTPGHRLLEKYAVACGGGWNHRMGLYDRVLLKDNHLAFAGSTTGSRLSDLVLHARTSQPDLGIEVEIDTLDQLEPVLQAGADIVLLDNFTPEALRQAVALNRGRALLEASGGVRLETLPELGTLGLDFISCGALVHQSTWVDIGLDWMH